ncbi:MAG: hypothetical protein WDM86_15255 [Rhizomicrobium sp.]
MSAKSILACVALGALLAAGTASEAGARPRHRYDYCYYHYCSGRWHDPDWRRHRDERHDATHHG